MERLDYRNKLILAPMVRIGTLPTRLLALDNGADIVYCEEKIDFQMLQCQRTENTVLGTVDYTKKDGTLAFRTCSREANRVVFQIGTANAQRALKVAKMVEADVAGIDVNMGCPKSFSIHGGMGAALLTQPEKVKEILTTLVQGVSIPVTCKIRILPTLEETLALVRLIESTGVVAIGVHGRMKNERPRHQNHNDIIRAIAQTVNIPVIANGGSCGIHCYEDMLKFREDTQASSVMVARAAEWNPSIFRKEGMLPLEVIIKAYIKYVVDYDNPDTNSKYNIQQLMHQQLETLQGQALLASATVRDICVIWQLQDYYDTVQQQREDRRCHLEAIEFNFTKEPRKRKLDDGTELYEMAFKFIRKEYPDTPSPKMILHDYTRRNSLPHPVYETEQHPEDKMFHSVVTVDGKKYTSPIWLKNKRYSEQGAAVVCLRCLGIDDQRRNSVPIQDMGSTPNHSKSMGKLPADANPGNQTILNSEDIKRDSGSKAEETVHCGVSQTCSGLENTNTPINRVSGTLENRESLKKELADASEVDLINNDKVECGS